MLPLLRCFFAHLLILQYPDHHKNLISSSLYYSGPLHKISSQSVHNFLSNNYPNFRQTNMHRKKNIDSLNCIGGGNYITIHTWNDQCTLVILQIDLKQKVLNCLQLGHSQKYKLSNFYASNLKP